jgi:hypothetical protein
MFNRVRWGNPASAITGSNFGKVTATANTPRRMQIALRFVF